MSNQNSANFLEFLEEGLREIFGDSYKQYPKQYEKIFEIKTSKKAWEEALSMSSLPMLSKKAKGTSVAYSNFNQGVVDRATHDTWGLAFTVERELLDDEQYGNIRNSAAMLGRSASYTENTEAANVLNNAFDSNYVGADGVELCSTVHPLIEGGTFSNEAANAVDLSMTSFEQALIDIAAFTDHRGHKIAAQPKMLVVAPSNDWAASQLLKSTLDPETANNAMNPAMGRIPYTVNNFLTDPDAWFITTDVPNGLRFYSREKPEFTSDNIFNSRDKAFKVIERFIATYHDPRGVYGSPGI
jgi:phage major head subunit gpT-like protein